MLETPTDINIPLLRKIKWNEDQIQTIQDQFAQSKSKQTFLKCLNIIYDYKLSFFDSKDFDKQSNPISYLHKKAIKSKVIKSLPEKTEEDVFDEVLQLNKNKTSEIQNIITKYKRINSHYQMNGANLPNQSFANQFKSDSEMNCYNYIIKAIHLTKKYLPRPIQIISALILLEKNPKTNRIAQILTGEGKTIIICFMAAYLVYKKHKVDIITSSEVLANQSYNETSTFFNLLGITVGTNCDKDKEKSIDQQKKKEIYTYDVVYGTAHSFEADILSDEYSKSGIRNERGFDVAIVDEIDNMFIDCHNYQTLLAQPTPFFEKLNVVFYYIWNIIKTLNKEDSITESVKDIIEQSVLTFILNEENNNDGFFQNYFPDYLKELVKNQTKVWINSAISAKFYFKENIDYVINKDRTNIFPVDYENTGVVQQQSHYCNGLHQFILLKHNLKIIPYSLTTNYLSNVCFFRRYSKKANVYGLTGTIGSQSAQNLLNELYNVDFVLVPPFKTRILYELTPRICEEENFLNNIGEVIFRETNLGRPILLLCQDIHTVEAIYNYLKRNKTNSLNIIKFSRNDIDKIELDKEDVGSSKVIISTNLSGRGTDIKINDNLTKIGGLHVCITFLPQNQRVQEQAYGRSGRKGQPGTWQLILKANQYSNSVSGHIDNLLNFLLQIMNDDALPSSELFNEIEKQLPSIEQFYQTRNKREEIRNKTITQTVSNLEIEDMLFEEYCNFLKKINEAKAGDCPIRQSIEERWAIWLLMNKRNKNKNELLSKFRGFCSQIELDVRNNNVERNPTFLNNSAIEEISKNLYEENNQKSSFRIIMEKIGDNTSVNYSFAEKQLTKSIKCYSHSFIPHYLKGITYALQKQIKPAISELNLASQLISEENLINFFIFSILSKDSFTNNLVLLNQNINSQIIQENIKQLTELNPQKIKIEKLDITTLFKENKEVEDHLKILQQNGLQYVFIIDEKRTILDNKLFLLVWYAKVAAAVISFACGNVALSIGLGASVVCDILHVMADSIRGSVQTEKKYFEKLIKNFLEPLNIIKKLMNILEKFPGLKLLNSTLEEIYYFFFAQEKLEKSSKKKSELEQVIEGGTILKEVIKILQKSGHWKKTFKEILKIGGKTLGYVLQFLQLLVPHNEYGQRYLQNFNSENIENKKNYYNKCLQNVLKRIGNATHAQQQKHKAKMNKDWNEAQEKLKLFKKSEKAFKTKGNQAIKEIVQNSTNNKVSNNNDNNINSLRNIKAIVESDVFTKNQPELLSRLKSIKQEHPKLQFYNSNHIQLNPIQSNTSANMEKEFVQNVKTYYNQLLDNLKKEKEILLPIAIGGVREDLTKELVNFAKFTNYDSDLNKINKLKQRKQNLQDIIHNDVNNLNNYVKSKNSIIQRKNTEITEKKERYLSRVNSFKVDAQRLVTERNFYMDLNMFSGMYSRRELLYHAYETQNYIHNEIRNQANRCQIEEDELNQSIRDNNDFIQSTKDEVENRKNEIENKKRRFNIEIENINGEINRIVNKINYDIKCVKELPKFLETKQIETVVKNLVNEETINMKKYNQRIAEMIQKVKNKIQREKELNDTKEINQIFQKTENQFNNMSSYDQDDIFNLFNPVQINFLTEYKNPNYIYQINDINDIVTAIIDKYSVNNQYQFDYNKNINLNDEGPFSNIMKNTLLNQDPNNQLSRQNKNNNIINKNCSQLIVGLFERERQSNKKNIVYFVNKKIKTIYCFNYNKFQDRDFVNYLIRQNYKNFNLKINNQNDENIDEKNKAIISLFEIEGIISMFEKHGEFKFDRDYEKFNYKNTLQSTESLRGKRFIVLYLSYIIKNLEKENLVDYSEKSKNNPYVDLIETLLMVVNCNDRSIINKFDSMIRENLSSIILDENKLRFWETWGNEYRKQ